MKKIKFLGLIGLCTILLAGCNDVVPEKIQVIVNEKKEEVKEKAVSELQRALSEQIKEFMNSTDLKKTLGLTDNEEEKVTESFKEYLENYDADPDEWKKAWDLFADTLKDLKSNGELDNITEEELNEKINELLKK